MLKHRIIPVVLLRNGIVVQSKGFKRYQALGNPHTIVRRLSDWAADELIYLDIGQVEGYDLRREDLNFPNRRNLEEILSDVAKQCFMPLTFGGGIRTLEDINLRLRAGADKVSINTQALSEPNFVRKASREFGSQCIVVSIDAKSTGEGSWEVFGRGGTVSTGWNPASWASHIESLGTGEILINSIDQDGMGKGYDIALIRSVVRAVSIPVIACGGVGEWSHFAEGITDGLASAVAAANIFQYTENSVFKAKDFLNRSGLNVRKPVFGVE
jgi:imidazole glycerol-phosphate synthase subunit HisF